MADPQQGHAKVTAFHRNLLGLDEFLGQVEVALADVPVYERPRPRWYALRGKAGSSKPDKPRGELELTVTFDVQSLSASRLSLGGGSEGRSKRLSVKGFAHTIGQRNLIGRCDVGRVITKKCNE